MFGLMPYRKLTTNNNYNLFREMEDLERRFFGDSVSSLFKAEGTSGFRTDISDKGDRVAVSVIGAENGELYTRVLIFDFDYQEPVFEYNYGSNTVSKVSILSLFSWRRLKQNLIF